ncbi:MAG: outer membrane porin, OprD family [Sulfurospirillum sp.]|nr:outer membrane porin, OprD family [Sulfurospirillum sp.]
MKLAKLSLAAIVVAGLATSSFAADTLADAFKNGKVSGALQGYYFQRDDGTTDADIFTSGVDLSFETDRYMGFGMKATFQGTNSPFVDRAAKTMFNGDMHGTGAQLSEMYLSYVTGKTTALVGRMYLSTPLVASSGSRVTKQAFEGAAVINTDIADTTLIAGYVQKFQARTDGAGNIGKFEKFNEDGAYTIAAINNSVKDVTLTVAWADVRSVLSVGYAEAAYATDTFGVAGQYYYNDYDNGTDSNLFGIKADATFGPANVFAAYSKVGDKKTDVIPGLGGGADLAYTGSPFNSDSYVADTKAYILGASYAVMPNANIGASYTVNKMDATSVENSYLAVEVDYAFEGALQGLSVYLGYEDQGKDADGSELRFQANYAF